MVESIEDYSLQNISNGINWRRSQTSIPYIKLLVFFRWRAIHKNARKGLCEGTENYWGSFPDVNLERQSPLGVFFWDKVILDFFLAGGRDTRFVTPTRVHRKYHISMYFLRKVIAGFLPKEKISCFREKKKPSFKIIQERSYPGEALFEKTFFSEDLKKMSYFLVFFSKRSSFIFCLRLRSYFRERETWSFPIIQEISYYNAIFLEKPSFQNVWKKKLWFSVQPLLASEKSSFSIFLVLKGLKIIQKKIWKPFETS